MAHEDLAQLAAVLGAGGVAALLLQSRRLGFLAGLALLAFGSGPVRGFAVTLAIGVVTTIITGVFVTRLLIALWFARTRPKAIVV